MELRIFLLLSSVLILASCVKNTEWDEYYKHVAIKPNTPEYKKEVAWWKKPSKPLFFKSDKPKIVHKELSKKEKLELKIRKAKYICGQKSTHTVIIPHQPTANDAHANGLVASAKASNNSASQNLLSGFASGLKGAENERRRQTPQVHTQFDSELFYLCMNEHGFYLEE